MPYVTNQALDAATAAHIHLLLALGSALEDSSDWRCRICGCTEALPCPEGCWWVEKDLCSNSVDGPACVSRSPTIARGA
jgi:hypothetical protein